MSKVQDIGTVMADYLRGRVGTVPGSKFFEMLQTNRNMLTLAVMHYNVRMIRAGKPERIYSSKSGYWLDPGKK